MPLDDLLWKCDNDYDTESRYQKGSTTRSGQNQGVCAGQSALWCFNMQAGVRDIFSKPDLTRAMLLQKLYDWKNDRGKLCESVGLTVDEEKHYGTYHAACQQMETTPGTYYISLYGHGVAAHVVTGYYYAFDPNFGLYRWVSSGKMVKMLRKSRKAVGISGSDGMRVFKVAKKN
jgi:hypothetical protein